MEQETRWQVHDKSHNNGKAILRIRGPIIAGIAAILGVAIFCAWPVIAYGFPARSDDGWIHARWSQHFSAQLWEGTLYPRWLYEFNEGLGSPAFFFYPPLPYYITSVVNLFVAHDTHGLRVLGISSAIGLAMSGLFAFGWLKKLASTTAAAAGAICYLFVPYHLMIDLYSRGAFAEFWAMTWLPLLLWTTYNVASGGSCAAAFMACAYAALVATHPPTTLIFSVIPPLYAAVATTADQRRAAFMRSVSAMVLGMGLASAYLIPALTLQSAVSMHELKMSYYEDSFLISGRFHANHNKLLWSLASMLLSGGLAFVFAVRSRNLGHRKQAVFWFGVAVVSFLMMLPLSKFIWEWVSILQIIQFPWRYGTVLSIATAALLTLAFGEIKISKKYTLACGYYLLWIIITVWAFSSLSEVRPLMECAVPQREGSFCGDVPEYRPRWANSHAALALEPFTGTNAFDHKIVLASGSGKAAVERWEPRRLAVLIEAYDPSIIRIRQYYFVGWTARSDGKHLIVYPSEPDGLVELALPKGEHRVEMRLERTTQEQMGLAASLVSIILICGLLIRTRLAAKQRIDASS